MNDGFSFEFLYGRWVIDFVGSIQLYVYLFIYFSGIGLSNQNSLVHVFIFSFMVDC